MTIKFDNFLIDLKALLDKHCLSFESTYDRIIVVNKNNGLDEDIDELFVDYTKN